MQISIEENVTRQHMIVMCTTLTMKVIGIYSMKDII